MHNIVFKKEEEGKIIILKNDFNECVLIATKNMLLSNH